MLILISQSFASDYPNLKNMKEYTEATKKGNFIIKFYANWCDNCPKIDISLEESIIPPEVKIYQVDYDTATDIFSHLQVPGVPSILFLKDGKDVSKYAGVIDSSTIESNIEKYF